MRMPAMPGASHPLSAACTKAPSSGAQSAGRTPLASRAGPAAVRSARKFHTKRATPATARASGSASSPATGRRMPTYAGVAGSAGSAVSARASGHASPGSPRSRHCASMPTVLLTAAASTCTAPGRERARAGARSARRPGARQQAPGRGGAARGPAADLQRGRAGAGRQRMQRARGRRGRCRDALLVDGRRVVEPAVVVGRAEVAVMVGQHDARDGRPRPQERHERRGRDARVARRRLLHARLRAPRRSGPPKARTAAQHARRRARRATRRSPGRRSARPPR